ncbi:MAG: VCBS repeat-containing protein [candidate division Zixibacteria bacterium]|nr:VCBS repeat-containing protein [Candidatus Tariuqbacter arcticus]
MILIFFILISLAYPLFAQEIQFQQEQHPFPVTFYGVEPQLGFTAANSYYHHDFGDLDNDEDLDLIVGADFGREYYFENIGTEQQPIFQIVETQIVVPFSGYICQAPTFCDIDNDNDFDIFIVGFDGYIIYFENIGGSNSPDFILADSSFEDIDIIEGCVSEFFDIDNDGDFDLFLGGGYGPYGGKIYYYENVGSPFNPDMEYVTSYFDSIDVGKNAAPEFCDIDGDGDYDLFVGCEDGTVWYYENIGDSVNYDFEYVTNNYFNIDIGRMSVPRFCDIEADGDFDLFVANESGGFTNALEGDIAFYENIGSQTDPVFDFVTGQYLFMDMSCTASPYAIDIDDDGILELLVGIIGGPIVYFENEGTQTDPYFIFTDSSFLNLNITYSPVLSFGDLDADGDWDMVVYRGGFSDFVDMYENTGTSSNPCFEFNCNIAYGSNWLGGGVDLCDIDSDGDLDLFIGDGYNRVQYWENIGDPYQPRFEFHIENYLNQPYITGSMYPRFNDIDNDGDYDLIMGHGYSSGSSNHIIFWQNIGNPNIANFVIADTIATFPPATVLSPRPCLDDIDYDGDDDMFVGDGGGAMLFYRNLENPLQPTVTISIQGSDVILTWSQVANAVEYRIFYQNIPYFTPSGTPQVTVFPPDTSWTDFGALGEGKRYYRMVVEGE